MTKKYMVLSSDGFTEDRDGVATSNMQLLGWANGSNPALAFEHFKNKIGYTGNYDSIYMQEIVGDLTYI